ncbi:MAG: nitrate reductase, partial [Bacteroidetes bacterium]|nr:nitrate reductase [Bacteroidota bacterium]
MLKTKYMLNNFLFIGLPYMSITIMLVGSIVRYRSRGYQVSSLSSQFLESRKLFFGTNP